VKLLAAELTPFSLRLKRSVVTGAQHISERRGLLLRLRDEAGNEGYGEASPITGFGLEEARDSATALRENLPTLLGQDAEDIPALLETFQSESPDTPCALSALDTALCDLASQRAGLPLASWLAQRVGRKERKALPANTLLVEQNPAALTREVKDALARGYRTLKLKVGTADLANDCARVSAVRLAAGPQVRIRLDANGAWNREQGLEALSALSAFDIEFIEQPVPAEDIEGLANLRARGLISIAADEAASGPTAVDEILKREACDWIVLKPSAVGGPHASLAVARRAEAASVRLVVTTLLDGAVGRAMALHVAAVSLAEASPGQPDPACGLATGHLLEQDFADGLEVHSGAISIPQRPGLGVFVDPARLRAVATGPAEVFEST